MFSFPLIFQSEFTKNTSYGSGKKYLVVLGGQQKEALASLESLSLDPISEIVFPGFHL